MRPASRELPDQAIRVHEKLERELVDIEPFVIEVHVPISTRLGFGCYRISEIGHGHGHGHVYGSGDRAREEPFEDSP